MGRGERVQTLGEIRSLLEARGLRPRKALGQNFLHDHNLIARLVHESGVGAGDLVLEIGPGTGALTDALLDAGCRVVASELDADLADLLRERFEGEPRVELIEGDCLADKHALSAALTERLGGERFALVANLPYQAGTPAVLALLTQHAGCWTVAVTVQKEVAERMVAAPGTKAYGVLGVVAQGLSAPRLIATLPPGCFWPSPKVTSAMVVAPRLPVGFAEVGDEAAGVARFATGLFSQRRKQIGGALRALGIEAELPEGVEPTRRVDALHPGEIAALARSAGAVGWRPDA